MVNVARRPLLPTSVLLLVGLLLAMLVGPAVGRAGAAPSATPPVTSGLQLWYEAGTESAADGATLTRWHDKSGFGRDLTAASSAAAPVFRANALNGRPALEFNGVTNLMKTYGSTFSLSQPTTFFIVYRSLDTNTGARAFVFDSRNSSVRQVLGRPAQNQIRLYANADLDFPFITYPFPSYGTWTGIYNGTSSALYEDGQLVGSGYAGMSALEGFTVGGLNSAGTDGYDLSHSLVAEILYYSGVLSPANRGAVESWLNEKYATSEPPTPPSSTAAPTVSGTAADDQLLTAADGTWSGSQPLSFARQWQRCNTSGGACADISQATGSTYRLTGADVGSTIRVKVTATNSQGSASATSAPTATVVAAKPQSTAKPSISGMPRDGSTLTADKGTWTGSAPISYQYQWRRCDRSGGACTDISGASATTYVPGTDDVGSTLRVAVTATNAVGSATATSDATPTIGSSSGAGAPPVTNGLQIWYDANAETYTDGAKVTSWKDLSGHSRDLSAATTAQAPTYRAAAVNGRAAVEFDGLNSVMKTYGTNFTLPQPTTFFIVYKSLDVATPGFEAYIFDSRNAIDRQLFGLGPYTNTEMYANTDIELATPYPFPDFQIWNGQLDSADSAAWRNGDLVASGYAGGGALGTGFTLGGLSTDADNGTGLYKASHSLVAEVLYYTGKLSATDRQSMVDWLNSKYRVIAPPTAPSNASSPTISGNTRQGATLTGNDGTWNGTLPMTFSYQWRRCDAAGANCVDIPGATTSKTVPQSTTTYSEYGVTATDVGATLRLRVTATNSAGSTTATSEPTAAIAAADSTAQPPVTSGLQLWYSADAAGYANGQAVTRWSDDSGYGRDLTAATPAAAPVYRANAVNGHAAIEFDGVSSLMKTYEKTFTLAQPMTFFIVYEQLDAAGPSNEAYVLDSRDSSYRVLFGMGTNGRAQLYANSDLFAPGTFPMTGFEIWSGTADNVYGSLWRNGSRVASGYAGWSANGTGITVGGLNNTGTDGYARSHSLISEILYYSADLNDADRKAVSDWLNAKYAAY
ncbi:MAG TPA: hypothetical protein VFT50_10430 [Baekduia sp.]|nr:hypothetical protein [Baekduia sp.]